MIRKGTIEQLEKNMLERREEILSLRSSLLMSRKQVMEPENEIEEMASKETMGDELELLDGQAVDELESIDRALDRIDRGVYGRCEICKRPIAARRLQALPWTTVCKRCAQAAESAPATDQDAGETFREALTDDLAVQAIWDELDSRETLDIDGLEVRCDSGTVYLSGHVSGDREYQLVMEAVEEDLGFEDVIDQINIDDRERQMDEEDKDERAYEEAVMMGQADGVNPYAGFDDRQ